MRDLLSPFSAALLQAVAESLEAAPVYRQSGLGKQVEIGWKCIKWREGEGILGRGLAMNKGLQVGIWAPQGSRIVWRPADLKQRSTRLEPSFKNLEGRPGSLESEEKF